MALTLALALMLTLELSVDANVRICSTVDAEHACLASPLKRAIARSCSLMVGWLDECGCLFSTSSRKYSPVTSVAPRALILLPDAGDSGSP